MHDVDLRDTHAALRSYVRRNAGSAAIAALLMCAYGYGMLAAPDPKDMFTRCNWVFLYTLRIGGVGMAGVAIAGVAGWGASLTIDGVLSVLIGVSFMLTGVGMFVGGGALFNSVLITVFGWLFAGAGWRDLRMARYFATQAPTSNRADLEPSAHPLTQDVPHQPAIASPPTETPAGAVIDRAANRDTDSALPGKPSPPASQDDEPPVPPADSPPVVSSPEPSAAEMNPPDPPGGGFLAELGRKRQPPAV